MNSLTEPLIGLAVYDRLRAGIRRIGGAAVGKRRDRGGASCGTALVLRLSDEGAFREFARACRLAEAQLTPEDVRQCSALHLRPAAAGSPLLAYRLDSGGGGGQQPRRGLRTSSVDRMSSGSGDSGQQQPRDLRYTGMGRRSGGGAGTGQQRGTSGGLSLGRIFGGVQPEAPHIGRAPGSFDPHHQKPGDSAAPGGEPSSTRMQSLLRSVARDVPLDPHAQSAVLLHLVDAYSQGVQNGVGQAGTGDRDSDKQQRVSEKVWKFFWGVLRIAAVVGALYLLITVLNPRDSLSKVMLTDISVQKETSRVRFGDVRGCDSAKKELEDVVSFLKHPEDFQKIGARLPRGVLLVGPPGVGKTMLAKAVAGEADVPFFQCSGSQFDEVFVGTGAARVRRLFEEAKKSAPCVIFIDEFDSVGGKRVTTTHHPYANQTVNQLLAEMDGFSTQDGIIVLAATNRPEILDSAVTRPGRFDVSIQVQLPDLAGRASILELYLSKVSVTDDVDVDRLAKITIGFSGAQLANVVNQAAVMAALEREPFIDWTHLQNAYNKVRMGTIGNKPRTEHVNAMTAAHESGHTIVALYTKDAPEVNHVTILPRGMSLGHTAPLPDEADQYGRRKSQLLAQIDMFMGGQAAEELIFGADSVTTGCSSDFHQATQIARMMVEKVGMSDALGTMSVAAEESSQQTMAMVDVEVKRVLDESRERARRLVRDKRPELERLTAALLEFESLDHDDILRVVAGQRPPKASARLKTATGLRGRRPSAAAAPPAAAPTSDESGGSARPDASWLKALLGAAGSGAGGGGVGSPGAGGKGGDGTQAPKI